MKVTVDRFEGEFAVVEMPNKQMVNMPKVLLPKLTKEGDVIDISIDDEETERRNERIKKLADDVWE